MNSEEIIRNVLQIYSNDKNVITKYLNNYIADDSKYQILTNELLEQINIPVQANGGISEKNMQKLRKNIPFDENIIFDTSDFYEYVLNKEISVVTDWDFDNYLKSGITIRLCRLFVNCCIPIYHLHFVFLQKEQLIEKSPNMKTSIEPSKQDSKIVQKINFLLQKNGFTKCPDEILNNRYQQLKTDLVENNASIYECLFSDFYLMLDCAN